MAQSALCEQGVHVFPVPGNDAAPQPGHQPFVRLFQTDGKQIGMRFVNLMNPAFLALQRVFEDFKRQKHCIILFQVKHRIHLLNDAFSNN
jgi:hypothetical protein